jgi:hypothetical protein
MNGWGGSAPASPQPLRSKIMTDPTIKLHIDKAAEVKAIVDNANALLLKAKSLLEGTRATLEALSEFQHPKLRMEFPYHLRNGGPETVTPSIVINAQVSRINALLGDRA